MNRNQRSVMRRQMMTSTLGRNVPTADSRKPPANRCAPLVGLLAIIERYWATDFRQSFSYGGTATTPPPLRSSHPLGTLNAAGTGDSAHCAAEALNRLLAIEGEFLGSLQYALLGVVIQLFVWSNIEIKKLVKCELVHTRSMEWGSALIAFGIVSLSAVKRPKKLS